MRNTTLIYVLGLCLVLAISCSGDSSEGSSTPPTTAVIPSATTLIFPENNTECNEGVIRSSSESTVNFRWESAKNADTYQVQLRDLNTNEIRLLNSATTNLEVTILRGNPYAWSVISRSNSSIENSESDVFQFYNAGLAIMHFAPFPAAAIAPRIGSTLKQGTIDLEWNAMDIDDDINTYTIFLATENPPTTQIAETITPTTSIRIDVPGIYFWNVITSDLEGNTSKSQIFQFRVN